MNEKFYYQCYGDANVERDSVVGDAGVIDHGSDAEGRQMSASAFDKVRRFPDEIAERRGAGRPAPFPQSLAADR